MLRSIWPKRDVEKQEMSAQYSHMLGESISFRVNELARERPDWERHQLIIVATMDVCAKLYRISW